MLSKAESRRDSTGTKWLRFDTKPSNTGKAVPVQFGFNAVRKIARRSRYKSAADLTAFRVDVHIASGVHIVCGHTLLYMQQCYLLCSKTSIIHSLLQKLTERACWWDAISDDGN